MIAFIAAALATPDAHPTVFAATAAPADEVQIDVGGGGALAALPFATSATLGGTVVRATVPLSERVFLGGTGLLGRSSGCDFNSCFQNDHLRAVGRLGVVAYDRSRLRVVTFAGGGTQLELGAAAWWQSKNERFELDLSLTASVDGEALFGTGEPDWQDIASPGPRLELDVVGTLPELGFTWVLNERGTHRLRMGQYGPLPTVSYRIGTKAFAAEVTAGTIGFASLASGSFSGRF